MKIVWNAGLKLDRLENVENQALVALLDLVVYLDYLAESDFQAFLYVTTKPSSDLTILLIKVKLPFCCASVQPGVTFDTCRECYVLPQFNFVILLITYELFH